jgi:excisionase family DNA binding protein
MSASTPRATSAKRPSRIALNPGDRHGQRESRQSGQMRGRSLDSMTIAQSTLETLVLQLRATLALAEHALSQSDQGQPVIYTISQVAQLLDCSEETVRRRVREGKLQAVTDGNRWLVSQGALDRYLSGDSSSSTDETAARASSAM